MSYSFDMDGWELFNTPFSAPVRTAQSGRSQQQPLEATQHNTTPAAAQRNTTPAPAPASDKKPAPKAPAPAQATPTKQEPVDSPKTPASTQPATPHKELVLDMSSSSGTVPVQDDTARRKAHEETEAKRKAEWEAKQLAKKQAEEAALQKLNDMSDDDVIAASIKRVSTDVERLTRRNMKECVAAHIQELAHKDVAFARRTIHPRKSMVNCFKYINRMAKEFIQQEMKDNDIKPENGIYGSDVPDGLCYKWAEDYFNATDAPEDQEKEEKFIPKPYVGTTKKTPPKTKKAESKAKQAEKQATKENTKNHELSNDYQQMSLF